MTRTNLLAVTAVAALFLAVVPFAVAGGGGNKNSSDAIWVVQPTAAASTSSVTLAPGQTFSAGFTSRASYPWAHAQCLDASGSAFWGEWRALQADGTIGVFDLTTANSGQSWPTGAVSCTLELVSTQPKMSVLASTTFSVVNS